MRAAVAVAAVVATPSLAAAQPAAFELRIGGILQYDGRFFVDEGNDPHVDQFAFRSARIDVAARLDEHWSARLVPDFAGSKLVVQDAYVDARYDAALAVRFGKMKTPFGLERLQDERDTAFTERGLPTQLAPNRDLGVQVFGSLARGVVAYQAGVFNGVADGGSADGDVSDDKDLAARVFVKPVPGYQAGVGAAVTGGEKHGHAASSTDVGSFKTPGLTTFFAFKVGTTAADTVVADGMHWRVTGHGYAYQGPFGVLAEYVRTAQEVRLGTARSTARFEAWQVVGQWVITGERATYAGVTPAHGYGAFEVAARFGELRVADTSTLEAGFADPTRSARQATSAGVGADWLANRAFRFMLDVDRTWYVLGAPTGDRPSETSIIGRAQAVF